MKIRQATQKDESSISEMFYKLYPKIKVKKDPITINSIGASCITLVAEDKEKVTGFVMSTVITYGPCKYGYIEEVYVDESSRRKGVGKKLINKLLQEFNRLNTWAVFVMTVKSDSIAQSFYKKAGFKKSKGLWLYMENI